MSKLEDLKLFEQRKKDHIKWSLSDKSQVGQPPSKQFRLIHDPLPEINFKDIKIKNSSKFLKNSKPLMVSSMTGGYIDAFKVNKTLIKACSTKNWAFSIGSLRKELEMIHFNKLSKEWIALKKEFLESVDLIGNIGIAQLISHKIEDIKKLCELYELKGLYVHLNPLQEVIQPEGTTNFKGGLEALKNLKENLNIPIFLKETGTGFSKQAFEKIKDLNLSAVDVSGFGGTHWGRIEGLRAQEESIFYKASKTFQDWGMTTVQSLQAGDVVLKDKPTELWASGGLRSGLDAAICFALGAKVCGFAGPMIKAGLIGLKAVELLMDQIEYELRIALFCTGTCSINQLNKEKVLEYGA